MKTTKKQKTRGGLRKAAKGSKTHPGKVLKAVAQPAAAVAASPEVNASWPVCESQGQAVAVMNERGIQITAQQLKAVKKDARFVDAFRGSRVYLELFVPIWLACKTGESADGRGKPFIDADIAEEKLIAIRRENAIAAELLVKKADVASQAAKFLADVSPMLDQKLTNEYPAQVVGYPLEEVRRAGRALAEVIKAKIREFAAVFNC